MISDFTPSKNLHLELWSLYWMRVYIEPYRHKHIFFSKCCVDSWNLIEYIFSFRAYHFKCLRYKIQYEVSLVILKKKRKGKLSMKKSMLYQEHLQRQNSWYCLELGFIKLVLLKANMSQRVFSALKSSGFPIKYCNNQSVHLGCTTNFEAAKWEIIDLGTVFNGFYPGFFPGKWKMVVCSAIWSVEHTPFSENYWIVLAKP